MRRSFQEALVLAVFGAALSHSACENRESIPFEPCALSGFSGVAECATVDVPYDHDQPGGRTLGVFVARVRAQNVRQYDAPLVMLAGGPGQAATDYGVYLDTAFRRVNETRDVILIDQRGTGRSHPLRCNDVFEMLYAAQSDKELRTAGAECAARQTEDLSVFGTESVIRDLDHIRHELGHEKLALWGASFGTRTALRYLVRFPDRVEAMVIDGVTLNTQSLFVEAPRYANDAFEALLDRCNDDPRCDAAELDANFSGVASLAMGTRSLIDPSSGTPISTRVDGRLVRDTVRSALYLPSRSGLVPLALERAKAGQHDVLAALTADTASWSADTMFTGATLTILCSEDVDRISAEAAKQAGIGSRFRDDYYRFWSSACESWPRTSVPADYGERVESSVPTLALSGGLDPVTPPASAEVAIKGLSAAQHVVAKNVGHNVTHLGCAPDLIASFLTDPTTPVDGSCLDDIEAPAIVQRGEIVQ